MPTIATIGPTCLLKTAYSKPTFSALTRDARPSARCSTCPFAVHYVMNPIIDIDGDTATGKWLAAGALQLSAGRRSPADLGGREVRGRLSARRWRVEVQARQADVPDVGALTNRAGRSSASSASRRALRPVPPRARAGGTAFIRPATRRSDREPFLAGRPRLDHGAERHVQVRRRLGFLGEHARLGIERQGLRGRSSASDRECRPGGRTRAAEGIACQSSTARFWLSPSSVWYAISIRL